MKRFKAILLCGTLVFTSAPLVAGTPLQVKANAKVDLPKLHRYDWEQHDWGYYVSYVKWNTDNLDFLEVRDNKNIFVGKYGPVTQRKVIQTNMKTGKKRTLSFLRLDAWSEFNNGLSGQCVSFVKAVTGSTQTTDKWKKGISVTKNTERWTVIANFQNNNTYPQSPPYGHVAILYQTYNDGGAMVIDQNYDHRTKRNNEGIPKKIRNGLLAFRQITASEFRKYHVVEVD